MSSKNTNVRQANWSGNTPGSAEEARNRIIQAFTERTMEIGLEKVNMSEVARAAGVTRPTLYKYFPNITELYLASVQSVFESFAQATGKTLAKHANLQEQLASFLRLLNAGSGGDNLYSKLLISILTSPALQEVAGEDRNRELYRQLEVAIAPALQVQSLSNEKREALVEMLACVSISVLFRPLRDDEVIEQMARMLVDGLSD